MKTKIIFFVHLITVLLYSQEYYGATKNVGKTSEEGNAIVIYFDNGKVRAYLQIYGNLYHNTYFHLCGKGSKNDKSLELQSIMFSEGDYYDGGVFALEFIDAKVRVTGERIKPIVLLKDDKASRSLLGEPLKKEEIKVDGSCFEVNEAREVKLYNYDKPNFQKELSSLNNLIRTKKLSAKSIKNFENDPALVAVVLFSENGFFSISSSTLKKYEKNIYKDDNYVVDKNYIGYTYKTCGDDYDVEEDYEGKCKTFNFYQNTSLRSDVVLIEVEIHSTCMDDSCQHDYHQLRLLKNSKTNYSSGAGWTLLSHKNGLRCDEFRGGGSPPCL